MEEEKKEPQQARSTDRTLPVMTESYVSIENMRKEPDNIRTVEGDLSNGRKRRIL
ncbi:MAG: hypothetical protein ABSG49_10690 [Methanoregula sp.]|uniref:hypothetical protein n=1 Tax=Methanoregula sp. TaxID=2052170 RepID=UPI003C15E4F6